MYSENINWFENNYLTLVQELKVHSSNIKSTHRDMSTWSFLSHKNQYYFENKINNEKMSPEFQKR